MKKCVFFFALFVLAVMAAVIIESKEEVDLIEEASQGVEVKDNLMANVGG